MNPGGMSDEVVPEGDLPWDWHRDYRHKHTDSALPATVIGSDEGENGTLVPDHLPECRVTREFAPIRGADLWAAAACICPSLRACEQRAKKEAADRVMSMRYRVETGWQEMKEARAYAAGIQAAREAVLAMVIETVGNSAATVEQVLAAIDALRQERSGNPDTSPSAESAVAAIESLGYSDTQDVCEKSDKGER